MPKPSLFRISLPCFCFNIIRTDCAWGILGIVQNHMDIKLPHVEKSGSGFFRPGQTSVGLPDDVIPAVRRGVNIPKNDTRDLRKKSPIPQTTSTTTWPFSIPIDFAKPAHHVLSGCAARGLQPVRDGTVCQSSFAPDMFEGVEGCWRCCCCHRSAVYHCIWLHAGQGAGVLAAWRAKGCLAVCFSISHAFWGGFANRGKTVD